MNPVNVSLFVYSFRGGGAEKVMIRIGNRLYQKGHSVKFIVADICGPYEKLVNSGIETIEIGGSNTIRLLHSLSRYIRHNNTDILLSTMEVPNIVSVVATRLEESTNVLLRIANMNSMKKRELKYKFIPRIKRYTYSHADSIVAVSEDVRSDVAATTGIEERNINVINNPSYNSDIHQMAQEAVGHDWINDAKKDVIIAVGSLKPQKDFSTLIRAVQQANKKQELYLIILGEGNLKQNLKQLAEHLSIRSRVCFPGFVDNPYAYMSNANVFVLSSAWEGFPNVVVEAMACGTPVVCTNCPGGVSEILDNGTYGSVVPVGDSRAMAREIMDMILNPTESETLINRARSYSVAEVCDRYESEIIAAINE